MVSPIKVTGQEQNVSHERKRFLEVLLFTTTHLNLTYVRPEILGDTLTDDTKLIKMELLIASIAVNVKNQKGKLAAHGAAKPMLTSSGNDN